MLTYCSPSIALELSGNTEEGRDAYAEGQTGGARIATHTELFSSLLSCEGSFSGYVDGLVQENCSGGPQL